MSVSPMYRYTDPFFPLCLKNWFVSSQSAALFFICLESWRTGVKCMWMDSEPSFYPHFHLYLLCYIFFAFVVSSTPLLQKLVATASLCSDSCNLYDTLLVSFFFGYIFLLCVFFHRHSLYVSCLLHLSGQAACTASDFNITTPVKF